MRNSEANYVKILERKSEEKVETRISMVQLNGQREKQNIKLSIYSLVNF